jgi:YVTN family beta-propeller protein
LCAALVGCGGDHSDTPADAMTEGVSPFSSDAHSSSIAVAANGRTVYVVNPDADSVSIVDVVQRTLSAELLLASAHPAVAADGSYTPAVMPRALALSPDERALYVTGQRSGALYAIDVASRAVRSTPVCSEPVGVVVSPDGQRVYVACTQDAEVATVSASSLQVAARTPVAAAPWGLAWSPSDGALLVTHFQGDGITVIEPTSGQARTTWPLPAVAARGDRTLAHGQVRGVYDVARRPATDELWVAHLLLGTDTAQPALDFQSTVFPAVSIVHADQGRYQATLSIDADAPGIDGAFGDVVSGPHALAFTHDGDYALVVDTNSEDLLAIDARTSIQAGLLRPLPGHMPEGIAIAPDGSRAYIDERNTGDVAVVALDRSSGKLAMTVDGPPIPRLTSDPMPAELRLGQHLFYSANSDEYPVTQNHWVACASCHLEGRSDAVTWLFAQGPRDTPSNAGGTRHDLFWRIEGNACRSDAKRHVGRLRRVTRRAPAIDNSARVRERDGLLLDRRR